MSRALPIVPSVRNVTGSTTVIAVPHERLPPDADIVRLMIGTAVGLLLAHWLAFRLAARITAEDGGWSPSAAQEAGAQLTGGFAVALLASAPERRDHAPLIR